MAKPTIQQARDPAEVLWALLFGEDRNLPARGQSDVTRLTREDIRRGIPVKSIGRLASLSNKQCDGLSVAEVLKRDIQ
jgi:hypothetical protein